ncbi:hydantoinase/oxoprolinase family protein [bacterium]|nr:hydantoinase/oxoprolinase family protein [bacterium]
MNQDRILSIYSSELVTDFTIYEPGRVETIKKFHSKNDVFATILSGIKHFESRGFFPKKIILSTTLGNTIIETDKGSRVALITTDGFKDYIHIGRRKKDKSFNLKPEVNSHVISNKQIFEVEERVIYNGKIDKELNRKTVKTISKLLIAQDFESVAIALINSPKNNQHELEIAQQMEKIGLPISVSSKLSSDCREYERISTTILNAFITPSLINFVKNLKSNISPSYELKLMCANGGVSNAEHIVEKSGIQTLFSGQIGGVIGAKALAKETQINKVLTFDMRYDSTDISIFDEHITISNQIEINSLPILISSVMMRTIGEGILTPIEIDFDGGIRVSPEISDKDSDKFMLSDLLFSMGFVEKSMFPDDVKIENISNILSKYSNSLSKEEYLDGILKIFTIQIARQIRNFLAKRGDKIDSFTFISYGEFGSFFAPLIAKELGITKIVVPKFAGTFSSFGMLYAKTVKDTSLSFHKVMRPSKNHDFDDIKKHFKNMSNILKKELLAENLGEIEPKYYYLVDLRYEGETQEITVPFTESIIDDFHFAHEKMFGYHSKNSMIELVTLRVRGIISAKEIDINQSTSSIQESPKERKVLIDMEYKNIPVFERDSLQKNRQLLGPAIVSEYGSLTYIPNQFEFELDQYGNLVILKVE